MMTNIYVENQDELNRKVQEYSLNGYKMDTVTTNNVIMKKKDYSLALFIILLFCFIIIGLIYYLLSDEYVVNIEINPQRSGEIQPFIGDPNMMMMQNTNTNVNNNVNSSSLDKSFCPECGTSLTKTDKFCPNCGKKV